MCLNCIQPWNNAIHCQKEKNREPHENARKWSFVLYWRDQPIQKCETSKNEIGNKNFRSFQSTESYTMLHAEIKNIERGYDQKKVKCKQYSLNMNGNVFGLQTKAHS